MESTSLQKARPKPTAFKQALVGLFVGCTLGPLAGWLTGTFAAVFAVAMNADQQSGVAFQGPMRGSAFLGGLLGIPLGLAIGPIVALPTRLFAFVILKTPVNPWICVAIGAGIGFGTGCVIYQYWRPSAPMFAYLAILSVLVGAAIGGVAVIAKPKWL